MKNIDFKNALTVCFFYIFFVAVDQMLGKSHPNKISNNQILPITQQLLSTNDNL